MGRVHKLLVDPDGHLLVALEPSNLTSVFVDHSGEVASGGNAQEMAPANPDRIYLFIQNMDDTEELWVNFTDDATEDSPSIRLAPYGIYELKDTYISTEAVSVIAATTSHKYTVKEIQLTEYAS